jgi:hypothetical protein
MRLGTVGPYRQRLPVSRLRLVQTAMIVEHDAQVVVRLGVIEADGDGLAVGRFRVMQTLEAILNHASAPDPTGNNFPRAYNR